jgi:lysine/ornithine N-monooxygenase
MQSKILFFIGFYIINLFDRKKISKNKNENNENTVLREDGIMIATGYRNECHELILKMGEFLEHFQSSCSTLNTKNMIGNVKNHNELMVHYFKELTIVPDVIKVPLRGKIFNNQ